MDRKEQCNVQVYRNETHSIYIVTPTMRAHALVLTIILWH